MSQIGGTLRTVLARANYVAIPGIYDAFSARLLEQMGFDCLYLPGNALGLSLVAGQPFVTLTETVDAVRKICGAVQVPLIADAGAGFGEPVHVVRTVRELEGAGAAAIHIDDQPYPKSPAYHRGKGGLAAASVLASKIRVASDARRSDDLMIIARTDTFKVTGSLNDVLERCRLYVDAGADALMVLNLTPDKAGAVRDALPDTPLLWFTAPSDAPPAAATLDAAGFAGGLYPFNTIASVAEAILDPWRDFAATGVPAMRSAPTLRETAQSVQAAIGMSELHAIENRDGQTDT